MAGLVPATHVLLQGRKQGVGARNECGHDSEFGARPCSIVIAAFFGRGAPPTESWPGLPRPPTSCFKVASKAWVPATSAGMTPNLEHGFAASAWPGMTIKSTCRRDRPIPD